MTQFIIAYRGGSQPSTPEEGAAQKAKWGKWMKDLGDAMVNPGTPMGQNVAVTADGVSSEPVQDAMTGYSIIEVADMDAALEAAKACPFLEMDNATLEVAQIYSFN